MMNQQPVMMHHGPMMTQPSQVMASQSQIMNQPQLLGQLQVLNHQAQLIGQPQMLSQSQVPLMNRTYKPWPQPQQPVHGSAKLPFGASMPGRSNWKGKNLNDNRQGPRKVGNSNLQARKFYPKKKFNNKFAPCTPRNTTSFIIRAKKSGGIASLVSPCPVTPSVLATPVFSPSRELLGDMAKEEWGVDGYGSMAGLIRLRDEDDSEEESDVEEGENDSSVLSRLDHEMSRFEMVCPCPSYGVDYNYMPENRVHDQDAHISQLEEENLTLRESLFLMEREMADLRQRLGILERRNCGSVGVNEEVVENNRYENEDEGCSDVRGSNVNMQV